MEKKQTLKDFYEQVRNDFGYFDEEKKVKREITQECDFFYKKLKEEG